MCDRTFGDKRSSLIKSSITSLLVSYPREVGTSISGAGHWVEIKLLSLHVSMFFVAQAVCGQWGIPEERVGGDRKVS